MDVAERACVAEEAAMLPLLLPLLVLLLGTRVVAAG